MVQEMELLSGVTLRCYRDTRFKQACLTVQCVRRMDRQEAALNALLPAVLLRGTKKYPDLRDIILRLDDLYGAAVGTLVRRVGDYQAVGLQCGFIEDRYALGEDRILEPMLEFVTRLFLDPVLSEGVFVRDYVESEKKNLIATISSQLNDKRAYAMGQLFKAMGKADSFGIPRLGEKEQVEKITPESAYAHYKKILRESPIHIFYVGSASIETVAAILKPLLAPLSRDFCPLPPQKGFVDGGKGQYTETMDVTQGKLCMGFTTPITLRDSRFAAMQVCNTVLGAGTISKLFVRIRERQSLCYDIGSGYHGTKGILTVSAGIDFDKETAVSQGVLEQLSDCARGEISEEELIAAKEAILSGLRSTYDTAGSIEGFYATGALSGLKMTPEAYMTAIGQVTKEQVAEAASTVRLHTQYFLKGAAE